uniref:Uncharacterized protein n=1 Tax=Rangifer tarandus platyrhynchus TaxID=3082113 RepID=A0ACB0F1B1_RANTA|nr:unnamed protein product [Rangifer tarandus platyrhynchus]
MTQDVHLLTNRSKRMTAKQGADERFCTRRRRRKENTLIRESVVKTPEPKSSDKRKPLKHPLGVAHQGRLSPKGPCALHGPTGSLAGGSSDRNGTRSPVPVAALGATPWPSAQEGTGRQARFGYTLVEAREGLPDDSTGRCIPAAAKPGQDLRQGPAGKTQEYPAQTPLPSEQVAREAAHAAQSSRIVTVEGLGPVCLPSSRAPPLRTPHHLQEGSFMTSSTEES